MIQIRKFFSNALHFIVYGNLLVSFGAYALCLFFLNTYSRSDLFLHPLPLFIFFATLFTYNFHRRIGLELYKEEVSSTSVKWMLRHPMSSRLTTLLSFAMAVYFFMDLPKSSYSLIAPLSLISLMYVIKFSDQLSLRQIPYLKIFLIALAWASAVVFLSALSLEIPIDRSSLLIFTSIACFMIAEVLPFDIRDMRSDKRTALKTIPNSLGIRSSIMIAIACLAISNLLLFVALEMSFSDPAFLSWLISSLYLFVCLVLSQTQRADLFYSLLVESSLFLPFLFAELFNRWA